MEQVEVPFDLPRGGERTVRSPGSSSGAQLGVGFQRSPYISPPGGTHEHAVAVAGVGASQSSGGEDVGGPLPERASWDEERRARKTRVLAASADLEVVAHR